MEPADRMNIAAHFSDAKNSLIKALSAAANSNHFHPERCLLRIEQPIRLIDPLKWLWQQKAELKIYWSERDRQKEMAGIGCADMITASAKEEYSAIFRKMRASLNADYKSMRYYGGFRFNPDEAPDPIWKDFGAFRFIIPLIEIVRENDNTKVAVNLRYDNQLSADENSIRKLIDKIEYDPDFDCNMKSELKSRIDIPDKQNWFRNIEKAKKLFQEDELEKIVLARRTMFEFSSGVDSNQLMAQIKNAAAKAFCFYFQASEDSVFFGSSPELLYHRNDAKIFAEAVAGTRPRGETQEIDEKIAGELLNSSKDVREHAFVCKHIEEAMNDLCSSVVKDDDIKILKSVKVQHLYKQYEGILKANHSDVDIISKLHPTPAVGVRLHRGGKNAMQALNKIREIEQFDRGWYAGPIGWVGMDSAEFAVGIRSGVVNQNKLYLFSGAGILPDSDAEQEWKEIEQKISQYLEYIQD